MSQTDFPKRWFLELDGKRMGPFSPEQVLGLLADGEIPADLRVLPDPRLGSFPGFEGSMTASALREAYYQEDRIPAAPLAETLAPPAADVEIPYAPEPSPSEGEQDLATTRRLFDLFQSAKEKRAARFSPSVAGPIRSAATEASRAKLISSAAAALVALSIGAWGLTRSSSQSGADRELAADTKAHDGKKNAPFNGSLTSTLSAQKELLKEPVKHAPVAPPQRSKPGFRNSWNPGKAIAKVAPHPRDDRREDRRDERDRRDDFRDERDRRDDERNLDQWNQAQDPAAQLQQSASAPLLNQMGGDAGIQPPPPVNAPAGVPMDGMPQDPNQAPGFTEQPAQ